jgi:hypothetical protein
VPNVCSANQMVAYTDFFTYRSTAKRRDRASSHRRLRPHQRSHRPCCHAGARRRKVAAVSSTSVNFGSNNQQSATTLHVLPGVLLLLHLPGAGAGHASPRDLAGTVQMQQPCKCRWPEIPTPPPPFFNSLPAAGRPHVLIAASLPASPLLALPLAYASV